MYLKTRWSLHRNHFQAAFQISDQPEVIYITNRGVLIGASTVEFTHGALTLKRPFPIETPVFDAEKYEFQLRLSLSA
jgi:hypothetical protein